MPSLRNACVLGLRYAAQAMAVAASLIMVAIVAVIMTSVLSRRFANMPIHIAEDVVGLMLSASLFLGLPLVTLRSQHVRVAIVAEALKGPVQPYVRAAAMLVCLAFFGWIFSEALPWFEFAFARNLRTETARLLLYPWMAVLPLSFALIFLICLARLTGLLEPEEYGSLEALPDMAPQHGER